MKKLSLLLIYVIVVSAIKCEDLVACHEEDMGGDLGIVPTLRGHEPSSRVNGLLVITESTTAAISTTTSCDEYTGYLEKNYDQIAENIARGDGIFLEALTFFYGCPRGSKDRFKQLFRENYSVLFINHEKSGRALGLRLEKILKLEKNISNKCSKIKEIS